MLKREEEYLDKAIILGILLPSAGELCRNPALDGLTYIPEKIIFFWEFIIFLKISPKL